MKQLWVFCSPDLEARVVSALDHAAIGSYLRLEGATGHRFAAPGRVPRTFAWESLVFLAPAAEDRSVDEVTRALEAYAGRCEIEPCLRLVVTPVESVK